MKFIITGTGRSGTTYCQAILRVCGLNVSHQKYITFKEQQELPKSVDGEASFMAVPFLHKYKDSGYKIIHVWRDPELVLKSWQKRGVLMPGWEKFYPDFFKWAKVTHDPIDSIIEWQDRADKLADYKLHIDSITTQPDLLFSAVGKLELLQPELVALISTKANTR